MIKKHKYVLSSVYCDMEIAGSEFYAKTCRNSNDEIVVGKTVDEHCKIVGSIAKALMDNFPEFLLKKLFPAGSELIASVHDIGKISPLFQLKIAKAVLSDLSTLPYLRKYDDSVFEESSYGGHPTVSYATLSNL